MERVSGYFLTTDKAIVTKFEQTIKKTELYKNLEFGDKWGVTSHLKFLDPLHITGTVEARNFKFGTRIGHWRS